MESIQKGKGLIITISVAILLIDAIIIGITALISNKIGQGIIRIFLEGLILFFLYKGQKWARWLISVLLILGGAFGLFSYLKSYSIIMLVLGTIFLAFGIGLISSKDVSAYINYKNGKLQINETEDTDIWK